MKTIKLTDDIKDIILNVSLAMGCSFDYALHCFEQVLNAYEINGFIEIESELRRLLKYMRRLLKYKGEIKSE